MAEDRKHSHKLSRLMCSCPPWWQPHPRRPKDFYIANMYYNSGMLHAHLKTHREEYDWQLVHMPYRGDRQTSVPMLIITDVNGIMNVLDYDSDIGPKCMHTHGCCVIPAAKSASYSELDLKCMRKSRDALHSDLLDYVWHPSRISRTMACV